MRVFCDGMARFDPPIKLTLPLMPWGIGSTMTLSLPMRALERPPRFPWMRVCITISEVLMIKASSPLLNCWAIWAVFACRASGETSESITKCR